MSDEDIVRARELAQRARKTMGEGNNRVAIVLLARAFHVLDRSADVLDPWNPELLYQWGIEGRSEAGLTGRWLPHDTKDTVVDCVTARAKKTGIPLRQVSLWLAYGRASSTTDAGATARRTSTTASSHATIGSKRRSVTRSSNTTTGTRSKATVV